DLGNDVFSVGHAHRNKKPVIPACRQRESKYVPTQRLPIRDLGNDVFSVGRAHKSKKSVIPTCR
ncbi:hypothetical protein, partial [Vibrio breoganii]|uniref:hypothetical protein n=1 Tax=Vibrio breoganii TaxID=553239 RepID=UPI001A7E1912